MFSIEKNVKNEIIINKSRFITYLIRIEKIEDVKEQIDIIKSINKDATHYCYAYILNSVKHFSDDGEPSGTAGMPMLNVIENNNLNYVLAVTVRYFGGIKLGAGGLVRAYTKSVTSTLDIASIIKIDFGYSFKISCNFDKKALVENLISNLKIENIFFDNKVNYTLNCNKEQFEIVKELLNKNEIEIQELKEVIIKSE